MRLEALRLRAVNMQGAKPLLLQHFVDLAPAVSLVGLPGGAYRHATGTALEAAWLLLPTIPTFQLAATKRPTRSFLALSTQ